jgi:RimJ/RimL family protein N-acetyltransferase
MDFVVRRIAADEWEPFRRLRLEALKDSPLAFVEQYDESLAEPDEFWRDRVHLSATDPDRTTVVAIHDGRFIGKASCFLDPRVTDTRAGHLVGVYVTPAARGTGVADAVVVAALRWAYEEAGVEVVRLFVTEINPRAEAFYRRLGFERTGLEMAYPPDPTYLEHEMRRRAPS